MPFSKTVLVCFTVIPMVTGSISAIGSSTIIAMIYRSKKKFGDPYRRLIFGISFFDLLSSLTHVFKIFRTTPEQPNAWLKLGNQTSCNILGFIHFVGLNGALLYNLSLNIYYLCLVKYNMTSKYYRNRVEPFLHGIPIIWSLVTSSIILGTGHINPASAGECLIAPYPANCLRKPDVECIRGMHTNLLRLLFRVVPTFVSFGGILLTLLIVWWSVRSQEKKMEKYRINMVSLRMQANLDDEGSNGQGPLRRMSSKVRDRLRSLRDSFRIVRSSRSSRQEVQQPEPQEVPPQQVMRNLNRRSSTIKKARQSRGRNFLIQARWYVVAFILTHTIPIVFVMMEWSGKRPPVPMLMVGRFLVPLQGLFNIFVYTRPHVNRERGKNPTFGWFAAFKKVVASGGDDDDEKTNLMRAGSMKASSARGSGSRRNSMASNSSKSSKSTVWAKLSNKLFPRRRNTGGSSVDNSSSFLQCADGSEFFETEEKTGSNDQSRRGPQQDVRREKRVSFYNRNKTPSAPLKKTDEYQEVDQGERRTGRRMSLRDSVLLAFDAAEFSEIAALDVDSDEDEEVPPAPVQPPQDSSHNCDGPQIPSEPDDVPQENITNCEASLKKSTSNKCEPENVFEKSSMDTYTDGQEMMHRKSLPPIFSSLNEESDRGSQDALDVTNFEVELKEQVSHVSDSSVATEGALLESNMKGNLYSLRTIDDAAAATETDVLSSFPLSINEDADVANENELDVTNFKVDIEEVVSDES